MCKRFGLTEAKPVHTPMDPKVVLRKAINMSELHPDNELYRAIIGSLMYALFTAYKSNARISPLPPSSLAVGGAPTKA